MFLKSVIWFIGITTIFAEEECILPAYPDHGSYKVAGEPNMGPGMALEVAFVNVTCDPGYYITGNNFVACYNGKWTDEMSQCIRSCKLAKHPSVTYRCMVPGIDATMECGDSVPAGTAVLPICNAPNYYSPGVLRTMSCVDGNWDYVALCIAECGRVAPRAQSLILEGRHTDSEDAPWHAVIYTKTTKPYKRICSGSLINTDTIISAAHCFWDEAERKSMPASNYAIAVGKFATSWNDAVDTRAQKSDVLDIKIPSRFVGSLANFQDDIAILKVASPFKFSPVVRPVCLDFDHNFDNRQLSDGNIGKAAAWSLPPKSQLQVLDVTAISIEKCINQVPVLFREYITSDKICGLFEKDLLVQGNSGAGVVFPEMERGAVRYYLRGVVSTSSKEEGSIPIAGLTHVLHHEHFIKNFVQ